MSKDRFVIAQSSGASGNPFVAQLITPENADLKTPGIFYPDEPIMSLPAMGDIIHYPVIVMKAFNTIYRLAISSEEIAVQKDTGNWRFYTPD